MATRKPGSSDVFATFGRRVAELRLKRGLTQEDLAERLGRAPRYVQQVEGGRQNVTLRTMDTLARALRVQLIELFRRPRISAQTKLRRVPTRTVRQR